MWLLFAFSGPVLWALSTHLDKYLVERYFRRTSMAVLVIITALFSRFESRGNADYADRLLSAMRKQFGGHVEKK